MKKYILCHHARKLGALTAAMFGLAQAAATGAVVININESGGNVVAVGSGSLNISALLGAGSGVATGTNPAIAYVGIGGGDGVYYEVVSGPEKFGSGAFTSAVGNGDKVGIGSNGTWLLVPQNYSSGNPINGTATWSGTTLAGLGLTTGTYVWTWGSGGTADSLTLNIGVVPEPSAYALFVLGAAGLAACRRRNRMIPLARVQSH